MTRDRLLECARADREFLTSNHRKVEREAWVAEQWLIAQGKPPVGIVAGDDPPDLAVAGEEIEVVEALEPRRRRGDEYKKKVEATSKGIISPRALPSLARVQGSGHLWVLAAIARKVEKQYDSKSSAGWILLVYADFSWADRLNWHAVESKLEDTDPPFGAIDVLYSSGAGPQVRRVFSRAVISAQQGSGPTGSNAG